jgi:hypothetical protein
MAGGRIEMRCSGDVLERFFLPGAMMKQHRGGRSPSISFELGIPELSIAPEAAIRGKTVRRTGDWGANSKLA